MRRPPSHALVAAGIAACAASSAAAGSDPAPYAQGSYDVIRKAHAGRSLVVHFWSVACPTCVLELADWARLARERRDIDFVFVNADRARDRPRVEARIDRVGLQQQANFAFAEDIADPLYLEVDRHWGGELPFTALIGPGGEAQTAAGALDTPQIKAWLAREAKAR
ncbi:thiol-disulfide isomerase [Methylosinus sp. Sm6]|uniref:TlpA family protein disulfide reductase n=1 Tax=Methylosinus sp. Sm6 TaxID=2866948 RepID=UPI0021043902|nr:thiol-disulfide isomerase [Methylosinus sp. Sm6]